MSFDGNGWTPEHVQTGARRLPEQWTIRLLYPRPPHGLSLNDRAHWAVKNAATKHVREEVFVKVRAARVPALERIRIEVIWWVTDNRKRDEDNPAPMLKAIFDGVGASKGISARIVEDDDPAHMEKAALSIERLPKGGTAHFEVRITDLGDAL